MKSLIIEDVDIPTRDDEILLKSSIYYTDNTPKMAPFIVNCPALLEHRNSKFVKSFTEKFADAGYYVLSYDHRGHGETAKQSRKKWARMIPQIFNDIHSVIDWILEQERKRLLGKKIALFGRSFGGAIILTHGYIDERVKKLIPLCTRYDYSTTQVRFSESDIRIMSPKYYIKNDPSNNERVLLAHCKDDDRIPFKNVIQIKNHLGLKDSNVLIFETGGHSFKGHRDEIFKKSLDFLKSM